MNMSNTTHTSDAYAAAEDLQAFVDRIAYVRCHMAAGEQAAFDKLTGYPYISERKVLELSNTSTTRDGHWPPIPEHAIEIDGRWMLPERLTEIDGKPYVRCYLHGLIPADHRCENSPGDHLCSVSAHPNQTLGEEHDDQATPHREWADNLLDRINAIRDLHVKDVSEGGMTGGCKECGLGWPCPTFHFASGWGEMHDCLDAGWCEHAGEKVSADEMGYIEPPTSGDSGEST